MVKLRLTQKQNAFDKNKKHVSRTKRENLILSKTRKNKERYENKLSTSFILIKYGKFN